MPDVRTPALGFGMGLRTEHYEALLGDHLGAVSWLEVLTENYLVPGGRPLHYLEAMRSNYPLVMHGVSLSIGSMSALSLGYLDQVKALADQIEAHWVSDHLCWTGTDAVNLHDLMPIPFTEEALQHVVARVSQVQEHLQRRILLENVSSYVTYKCSELTEWDFLREVAERADCLLLLDINNVYVS